MAEASPSVLFDRSTRLMVCGGGAGAIAKTLVAPFERVKILNQLGESHGFFATFRNVVKQESVFGMWKGNYANVVRCIHALRM